MNEPPLARPDNDVDTTRRPRVIGPRRLASDDSALTPVAGDETPGVVWLETDPPLFGLPRGVAFLLLGIPAAFFFSLPIARFMGWFLGSLVHEMGHSLAAWMCGCPSFPAIRLDGHAAAIHGEAHPWFAGLLSLLLIAAAAGTFRQGMRAIPVVLGAIGLVLPFLAFTNAREPFFLSMGHGGELLFAGVFLHRALSGGFTHQDAERLLYGCVGWYLIGRNAVLFAGLWSKASARDAYHGSGSFGLENDLIRLANDVPGWSLPSVGLAFLLLTLVTPPLAIVAGRWLQRDL